MGAMGRLPTLTLREHCIFRISSVICQADSLKGLYLSLSSPNCFLNEVFSRSECIVPIAERFEMGANAVLDNV
jgi:hypothetical protein